MPQINIWITDDDIEKAIRDKGDLTLSRYLSKVIKEKFNAPAPQTGNISTMIREGK